MHPEKLWFEPGLLGKGSYTQQGVPPHGNVFFRQWLGSKRQTQSNANVTRHIRHSVKVLP
jgi:hypothetical protein